MIKRFSTVAITALFCLCLGALPATADTSLPTVYEHLPDGTIRELGPAEVQDGLANNLQPQSADQLTSPRATKGSQASSQAPGVAGAYLDASPFHPCGIRITATATGWRQGENKVMSIEVTRDGEHFWSDTKESTKSTFEYNRSMECGSGVYQLIVGVSSVSGTDSDSDHYVISC